MAPEIYDNQYNEKCDLWSVGVILFVLLSNLYLGGRFPFGGRTEKLLIREIQHRKLEFQD